MEISDQAAVIIIFGITGDLSKRKLLPALYDLFKEEVLGPDTKIFGTSRRELDKAELLSSVELDALSDDQTPSPKIVDKMNQALSVLQIDPENDDDYEKLKTKLDELDDSNKRLRLYYMSVPSSAYEPIVDHLAKHGLNDDRSRLMLEKPFGHDLNSAEASIKSVHSAFKEEQIYRIDHYLAKEMSQNIIEFRLKNPVFNKLWNSDSIASVHIKQHETLGIEGRADFYEQTGALRDVLQNHLMQLLAISLMTAPSDLSSEAIHKAKLEFFNSLEPADPNKAVRAQYDGYKEEVENPASTTETYAKVSLRSKSDQWKNIDFTLEHGKAMPETLASVTIHFKNDFQDIPSSLTFRIQPNDGIIWEVQSKKPGLDNKVKTAEMDLLYKDVFKGIKAYDAYEKVIVDSIRGDQSLFASDDEVIVTWQVIQPVIDAWTSDAENLKSYAAKSKDFILK
jgi:glucose-6-phosphate 1-dehydrogenase